MSQPPAVILFDGVCNLCNASINFVIDRDKQSYFTFGALQSVEGERLLSSYELPSDYLDSIILIENESVYCNSDAALRIARKLSGAWPLFYGFVVIPAFLRDPVYKWIARNRYRWFGKQDACRLPTPELKARFLG